MNVIKLVLFVCQCAKTCQKNAKPMSKSCRGIPSTTNTMGLAHQPQSAKMLIFLQNGEQRLITFTLPRESCTLQEVLEQVNVPFSEDTHIQCMQNTSSEIDYFVSVGSTTRIEDMLENHPVSIILLQPLVPKHLATYLINLFCLQMFVGNRSSSSSNTSHESESSGMITPERSPSL
ncbi:hypothetical protein ABMA28_015625 [Loxostege sticticalis]|uniref:Uncharacterized protein n=1 Tax=Loxostege sticticalis TaxID=481309 RepID=A0ABD0TAG8_LOXSC